MHLIAIGWLYVVLMMALVEAMSSQGTVLGAVITFVFYGLIPLALVLYIVATPARRRARRAVEESAPPDGSGHAPGQPAAPERKEP